jgi:SAM-dependent methyltransferase
MVALSDARPRCRSCAAPLEQAVVDLRASPLANSFLKPEQIWSMEPTYPLRVLVCTACWLVQLPAQVAPEDIFSDYVYFSSYSDSWLKHAETYAASMTTRLRLSAAHLVVEIASNDGYLLQYFVRGGVRVLGVEPAANIARVATEKGIPTLTRFFGTATARELVASEGQADLLVGNNVLAHVPDLNDFIAGLKLVLKPDGVLTMEFPHLLRLIESVQFDTIYHEHYSYFSFAAAEHAFARHGIVLFDVDELPSHGGSLRIFGRHHESAAHPISERVDALRGREQAFGLTNLDRYAAFAASVEETKRSLLQFLIEARRAGKSVAGYGAPAKGNTLLNYCGIGTDLLEFTVDRSEHKHGTFLPGSRIPVFAPATIAERRPDYVLILPWNLRSEIMQQMAHVRDWGGRFVVPVPRLEVLA